MGKRKSAFFFHPNRTYSPTHAMRENLQCLQNFPEALQNFLQCL